MTPFFWPRRKHSKEVVLAVDALLRELVPDEKFHQMFEGKSKRNRMESLDNGEPDCEGAPAMSEEDQTDENSGDESEKTVSGELEKRWARIRSVFYDWDEQEEDKVKKMERMAELLLRYHVLQKVLHPRVLSALTFETKKYVGHVFRAMTVHNLQHFSEFLSERPEIMRWLAEGYRNNDTALICGAMLRDCFEYQELALLFLHEMHPEFALLFTVTASNSNFDISADAFMNITRLLTRHKQASLPLLEDGFDRIFGRVNSLLSSTNYVVKRQALQLLAELLLDPVNFTVMQQYVASRDNLKAVMLLLRENSPALRMDAFHVFKIFVANPNKSREVECLLQKNQKKLLQFVSDFGKNETNREFQQERSLLIFTLQRMAEKESVCVGRDASVQGLKSDAMQMGTSVAEVMANHR